MSSASCEGGRRRDRAARFGKGAQIAKWLGKKS
jgi:hypothetical protein